MQADLIYWPKITNLNFSIVTSRYPLRFRLKLYYIQLHWIQFNDPLGTFTPVNWIQPLEHLFKNVGALSYTHRQGEIDFLRFICFHPNYHPRLRQSCELVCSWGEGNASRYFYMENNVLRRVVKKNEWLPSTVQDAVRLQPERWGICESDGLWVNAKWVGPYYNPSYLDLFSPVGDHNCFSKNEWHLKVLGHVVGISDELFSKFLSGSLKRLLSFLVSL